MYKPPTPKQMKISQNRQDNLELLLVQRKLYSRAKRYLGGRLIGMFLIAILAPVIGSVWPSLAVACGAIAGLWIYLGRTLLSDLQLKDINRAAAVQSKFDENVFGMPENKNRENLPSLEEIAKIAADNSSKNDRFDKLRDWYEFIAGTEPVKSVAIAQRANVSYSDSLLKTTARVWTFCIIAWAAIALIISIQLGVKVENLLFIFILPLLPAFLDLREFSRQYYSASHIRSATADEIEDSVDSGENLSPDQLLVWQERIYELRRTTPLVPDFIYWIQRKSNERAMKTVASKLSKRSKSK